MPNNPKGFTLIEILVVIVIIGILSTIGLQSFLSSQAKSRDAKRKSDLKQIGLALETYYNDKGEYPGDNANGSIMGCDEEEECSWGEEFSDENGTIYMVKLPDDPGANQYYYVSDNTEYQLYARLENTLDINVPKNGANEGQVYSGTDCGEYTCNYGVASSNSSLASAIDE